MVSLYKWVFVNRLEELGYLDVLCWSPVFSVTPDVQQMLMMVASSKFSHANVKLGHSSHKYRRTVQHATQFTVRLLRAKSIYVELRGCIYFVFLIAVKYVGLPSTTAHTVQCKLLKIPVPTDYHTGRVGQLVRSVT
jgi:hypothetical protein